MSQALRRPMTTAEFLEWEEQQEDRYEFDGHGIVAMNGGTVAHSMISTNVLVALQRRLENTRCRAHGGGLKIEVAGSIRYPDAFVACTAVVQTSRVITEPVIVFEVLSPSTATVDLTEKHDEYRDTPSVMRYVILRQDRIYATVFTRSNGIWSRDVLADQGTLALDEIGIEIPMAEIYKDLVFTPA